MRHKPGLTLESARILTTHAHGVLVEGRALWEEAARPVVCWVASPALGDSRDVSDPLVSATEKVARLDHPNILPVVEWLWAEGRPVGLVPIDAKLSLRALLDTAPPPLSALLEIGVAVADVLDTAWRQVPSGMLEPLWIVHRDIRPESILLGPKGEIRVVSPGLVPRMSDLSHPLERSLRAWSADYLAPEQRPGAPPDPAMDVYALGITLLEALTRVAPTPTSDRPVRHRMQIEERLAALFVDAGSAESERELRGVLSEMLAFLPEDRPTAEDVARRLGALRRALPDALRVPLADHVSGVVGANFEPRDGPPLPEEIARPLFCEFRPGVKSFRLPGADSTEEIPFAVATDPVLAEARHASDPAEGDASRRLCQGRAGVLLLAAVILACALLIADTFLGFLPLSLVGR